MAVLTMTRDDIIRMAREADQYADDHAPAWTQIPNEWQELRDHHFAALVAAAERDACAKVCEAEGARTDASWRSCAAAIRARGQV